MEKLGCQLEHIIKTYFQSYITKQLEEYNKYADFNEFKRITDGQYSRVRNEIGISMQEIKSMRDEVSKEIEEIKKMHVELKKEASIWAFFRKKVLKFIGAVVS